MTATYDLIASNVLTSSAASVTFSSIPATYRDLLLVASATANTNTTFNVRFNSDSGSNYSYVRMQGNGSTASSSSNASATAIWEQSIDTVADQYILQIMDYSATDKHKTVISRHNRPNAAVWALSSRWANTSAINSIELSVVSPQTLSSGSTFYLYGIVS
jgi:hypothetical protein